MSPGLNMFHRITTAALALCLVVVVFGAYVRLSDAGLGCPDWPGCYGHLAVPTQAEHVEQAQQDFPGRPVEHAKAWKEMIHRYLASTLGLLILALAALSFRAGMPRLLPRVLVTQPAVLSCCRICTKNGCGMPCRATISRSASGC